MKKLFFIMTLACCIMPRALGSPPTLYAFSAKWTPLQVIVLPLALFDEATPVYGLNLTTFGGFHSKIYGISCGMLSNCAMHTGMEVGLANGAFNSVGLMLGGGQLVCTQSGGGGRAPECLRYRSGSVAPYVGELSPDRSLQLCPKRLADRRFELQPRRADTVDGALQLFLPRAAGTDQSSGARR